MGNHGVAGGYPQNAGVLVVLVWWTGSFFNIMMLSYQIRNSYYKDKAVVRWCCLYNGNSYSLYDGIFILNSQMPYMSCSELKRGIGHQCDSSEMATRGTCLLWDSRSYETCMVMTLQSLYRQTSNIRHTKSENLNVSRLVLQLSLRNLLKPGVKSRMKM